MAVGDVPQARVFASIGQGWTNMWSAFWMLLLFALIEAMAGSFGQATQYLPKGSPVGLTLGVGLAGIIFTIAVAGPVGLGTAKAHLAVTKGEKPQWSDLGYGFTRWPQAMLLTLLSILIILAGFILLIIPGIYVGVKLTFAGYRFVKDDLDAVDAIKASWADTKGRWWNVFGLALMAIPIVIAGFLAFGVGIFVAIVWISQSNAVYFRAIDS